MPGCYLSSFSAKGDDFEVDRFLRRSDLKTDIIGRRGETIGSGKRKRRSSSFCVYIGDDDRRASWYFERAERFLRQWQKDIRKLQRDPSVTELRLEFVSYRRTEGVQSDVLPASLLKLAGSLGVDIEWSLYPNAKELSFPIPRRAPKLARALLKKMKDSAVVRPA